MSKERLTIDDPRLTAYVLDELEEPERTQLEAELAENPRLQAAVDELRLTATEVFAALQTEPAMALTDEQLERIRTAARDEVPSSPAIATAGLPAADSPHVAIVGAPRRSSVPRSVASSAIVLAGLVLTTAAIVLSPHFPRPGVDEHNVSLPEAALLDDSSDSGVADDLLGARYDVSTTFADDVTAFHGPALNYDELRGAFRLEVPDSNGRVNIQYVALVKAPASGNARGAKSEDGPAEQNGVEPVADEQLGFSFFGLADIDGDSAIETNGSLNVADINGNGRLDDDPLFFAPADYEHGVTANTPAAASATRDGLGALQAGGTPPPPAAGEADGGQADDNGDGTPEVFYVVPYYAFPLVAQNEGRQRALERGLSLELEAAGVDRLYYDGEMSGMGGFGGAGVPGDMPAPAAPAPGVAGSAPTGEELRRLNESEPNTRLRRYGRVESLQQLDESLMQDLDGTISSRPEPAAESGGQRQSGQQAPIGGGLPSNRMAILAAEQNAQDRVDEFSRGGDAIRQRGDGERLPAQYRQRLERLVEEYGTKVGDLEAQNERLQSAYRSLQSERQTVLSEGERRQLDAIYQLRIDQHHQSAESQPEPPKEELSDEYQLQQAGQVARERGSELGWAARDLSWGTGRWDLKFSNGGEWGATPGTESYAPIVENDFVPTLTEPVSTFSIDVDTGSYSNCRRFIENDMWPPADAVRVEELVNSFSYNDPPPAGEDPIAVNFDVAACPWQPQHRLVRIGVRAADIIREERPPTRLVFLVDVSGSMKDANKLPLVRQSLHLLVDELGQNDRVAIVTYATDAALRLESTPGNDRDTILAAVDALGPGGSTNGEGGLRLAYQVAENQFEVEASNRVILCTDGDFNVGETDNSELVRLMEEKRDSGVFLSVYGFGMGNLEDDKLEQIADHGNGQYGYIDSLEEAKNIFVQNLTGTLYTVAKDVKLQVDFNPAKVTSYRLIGYENRALENADFDNDVVDAGDVGAGHSVTALYQVAPRKPSEDTGSGDLAQASLDRFLRLKRNADQNVRIDQEGTVLNIEGTVVSEERKQEAATYVTALLATPGFEGVEVRNNLQVAAADEVPPAGEDLLKLRVSYKHPNADESRVFETTLVDEGAMQSPSKDFQWASAVASYGMLLRQSRFRGDATFDAIIETAQAAVGDDPDGRRQEFVDLVRHSRALYVRQTGQSSPPPVELTSVDGRERATCGGKYSDLQDKLEVPEDFENYGAFRDYGYWEGDSYRTFTGLPAGYWVYVYPHWYIWGESK